MKSINCANLFLKLPLICLIVFFSACETREPVITEPDKPSGVPVNSIWVGGLDGGVFVLIKGPKKGAERIYFGSIYHASGDLSYQGEMKIFPDFSKTPDLANRQIYQGWDGDTLYLSGSRYLKIQE